MRTGNFIGQRVVAELLQQRVNELSAT